MDAAQSSVAIKDRRGRLKSCEPSWGASMPRVVGVHGMAQEQKTRPELWKLWYPSLRGGMELAAGRYVAIPSFDLAFYGKVFLSDDAQGKPVAKGNGPAAAPRLPESPGDDELAFLDEAVNEVAAEAGPKDKGVPKGLTGVPAVLQPLAGRLARRFSGSLALTFITALRQVRLYLEDEDTASQIRAIVTGMIDAETRVVVAHSLGTVVAFDALSRDDSPEVGTLITLGSPLGMKAVSSRLAARLGNGPSPRAAHWINIFDPADPVAAAGAVSLMWPQAGDFTVDNGDEQHDVTRYLGKRVTGQAVVDACGR